MDAVVYDEITTQVGKKDDTASATGSLHAKTAYIGDSSDVRTDDTVMGRLATGIKSWQRLTGTSSQASDLTLTLSTSVTATKCIVTVEGCNLAYENGETISAGGMVLNRYISAFNGSTITLKQPFIPAYSSGAVYVNGTFSVIVTEFY